MALKDKLKTALDETRLLILGSQILFGFQFNGMFQEGFGELSQTAHWLNAGGFFLMAITVALLIAPSMQHRLVERGEDSVRLHEVTSQFAALALMPFALSLGLSFYLVLERPFGVAAAAAGGAIFCVLAMLFWFGIEHLIENPEKAMTNVRDNHKTPLHSRIEQMLTEARVLLPGAQALLGFQFAVMFTRTFEQLPQSSKLAHVAALAFIALSVILLITPAAIHRLSFGGEDTEEFHLIGSRFVVAAAIPLGLGIGTDLYVAILRATASLPVAIGFAVTIVAVIAALWFVQPYLLRLARAA